MSDDLLGLSGTEATLGLFVALCLIALALYMGGQTEPGIITVEMVVGCGPIKHVTLDDNGTTNHLLCGCNKCTQVNLSCTYSNNKTECEYIGPGG